MKIGTEIVLKNTKESTLIANLGDNLNTEIDGAVYYEPGSMVPVILESVGKVGCYGKIVSVTITELKTKVVFECIEVSDDIAEAAYKIYAMTSGNSVVGSYTSKSSKRSGYSSGYSLKDDDRPELEHFNRWNY